MGVSDFRRFGAAERAVWPVARAGTAASSGWSLGPELTLTSHTGAARNWLRVRSREQKRELAGSNSP
eukprot:2143377-Alexandrium_andersonii.AAC.1